MMRRAMLVLTLSSCTWLVGEAETGPEFPVTEEIRETWTTWELHVDVDAWGIGHATLENTGTQPATFVVPDEGGWPETNIAWEEEVAPGVWTDAVKRDFGGMSCGMTAGPRLGWTTACGTTGMACTWPRARSPACVSCRSRRRCPRPSSR